MALIEITVDNPALIRTGEERTEGDAAGPGEQEGTVAGAEGREADEERELIDTVGAFVAALSTLAGVLQRLRSEEEDASIGGDVEDDIAAGVDSDDGFDEIDEIDEIGEADGIDDAEDETLETGLEGEDEEVEGSSGTGLGAKVAVVLVILLVVAVLWFRGGDEETEFEA